MTSGTIKTLGWWSVVVLAGLALAVTPVIASAGMQPLSSGIGLENRQPHPEYPLKLVFAMSGGAYLANVNVTILDSTGKEVATLHSPGPWLFVDLPAGTYKVLAKRANGELATAMLHLTGDGQQVLRMTWKGQS